MWEWSFKRWGFPMKRLKKLFLVGLSLLLLSTLKTYGFSPSFSKIKNPVQSCGLHSSFFNKFGFVKTYALYKKKMKLQRSDIFSTLGKKMIGDIDVKKTLMCISPTIGLGADAVRCSLTFTFGVQLFRWANTKKLEDVSSFSWEKWSDLV